MQDSELDRHDKGDPIHLLIKLRNKNQENILEVKKWELAY